MANAHCTCTHTPDREFSQPYRYSLRSISTPYNYGISTACIIKPQKWRGLIMQKPCEDDIPQRAGENRKARSVTAKLNAQFK